MWTKHYRVLHINSITINPTDDPLDWQLHTATPVKSILAVLRTALQLNLRHIDLDPSLVYRTSCKRGKRASKPACVTASILMYNIQRVSVSVMCECERTYFTITITGPEILLHLPSGLVCLVCLVRQFEILHAVYRVCLLFFWPPALPCPPAI